MVTIDCPPCEDFVVSAHAFCEDVDNAFQEGMYYVEVDGITGGYNLEYAVTIGLVTLTGSGTGSGMPAVFGPFSHSVSGTGFQSASITETGSNCTFDFEITETLCTDIDGDGAPDNDFSNCDCSLVSLGINPGTIVAQAEPGTFVSGGTTGQRQYYLLVDGSSGTVNVIDGNLTGWFPDLLSDTYYVYAINYDLANSAAVQAALVGTTINITALSSNTAPFDSDCYKACGLQNTS